MVAGNKLKIVLTSLENTVLYFVAGAFVRIVMPTHALLLVIVLMLVVAAVEALFYKRFIFPLEGNEHKPSEDEKFKLFIDVVSVAFLWFMVGYLFVDEYLG